MKGHIILKLKLRIGLLFINTAKTLEAPNRCLSECIQFKKFIPGVWKKVLVECHHDNHRNLERKRIARM